MNYVSRLIIVLAIASFAPQLLNAADTASGKTAYSKKCASCHGQSGEGKETMAKMLKVELRHLGSKEVQAKSDAELKKITIEGVGKMKPTKDIDDKTAEDIVAYLRSLAKK